MQLVLSNNRIIAHGENFLSMGGVVINTETGAKYENATIAECNGACPSDIGEVGYEYHAGVFVPCAPFGKGNNNGYFMEVCECATPRNSGISIIGGLSRENLNIFPILWENAAMDTNFNAQTIPLTTSDYVGFIITFLSYATSNPKKPWDMAKIIDNDRYNNYTDRVIGYFGGECSRNISVLENGIQIGACTANNQSVLVPNRIYGVKL